MSKQSLPQHRKRLSEIKKIVVPMLPGARATELLRRPLRQLASITLLLLLLTVIGTLGLRWTTGASWFDCTYMAVITLTTVGYGESVPLGTSGRIFIMVYLAVSIGVFTFSAFTLGSLLVSNQLHDFWKYRRMQHSIQKLSNHYIVCGLGRMGNIICEYLQQRRQPFVVIDLDEELVASLCESRGWLAIVGDATDDQILVAAGIERAQSLAAVLPTDSDNVYVVLSARILATDLQIIARASSDRAIEKLEHAGASRVVSPFTSGAVKMARFMLNPSVEDFLEITDSHGDGMELVDVQVRSDSPHVGKAIAETDFREKGVMVIGIRRRTGEYLMPPQASTKILAGDSLIVFGNVLAVNATIAGGAQAKARGT